MAVTTLVSHKLRSSLTMLGIVIGNASVIMMVGIGQGAQNLAQEQFKSLGPNTLFIVPGTREARRTTFELPKTLVLADAEAIKAQVPTIIAVSPELSNRQVVSYRDRNKDSLIYGTTPEFLEVRKFNLAQGRFLTNIDVERNNRVAVIGQEIVDRLFPNQNPIGQTIRISNLGFEVIGVMEAKGSFMGTNQDNAVYIPLMTMANQIIGRTSPYGLEVSWISVLARDAESVSAAKFQIENLLRRRHKIVDKNDFGVESAKEMIDVVGKITGGLKLLLTAIAAISLLVGGIGVMNIMLVSVNERTQEIGLRKAVGAQEIDILGQFLIESIILSALGGLVGTAIGITGITVVATFSTLKATVSVGAVVLAVGVSGGIGLFFGVFPARQAAKLDPIVALRSA